MSSGHSAANVWIDLSFFSSNTFKEVFALISDFTIDSINDDLIGLAAEAFALNLNLCSSYQIALIGVNILNDRDNSSLKACLVKLTSLRGIRVEAVVCMDTERIFTSFNIFSNSALNVSLVLTNSWELRSFTI